MSLASKILSASGGGADPLWVDSVFSAYTYTGNGATQTITNGIDLAGKGGMVWCKRRNGVNNHSLVDTARGMTYAGAAVLASEQTSGTIYTLADWMRADSTGFSLGTSATGSDINSSGNAYVSWTFRKAPKFFDVVTWNGNDSTNRVLNHSLGITPGTIIVKRTDAPGWDWQVWHRSITQAAGSYLLLNTTAAAANNANDCWGSALATNINASTFSIGAGGQVNTSGGTYVAYLFAHDSSADGIVQCGSFTTDGSGNATVNLGWEPQYLMVKNATGTADNWKTYDVMRGFDMGTDDRSLYPNTSGAEASNSNGNPTATGFAAANLATSVTYIYLAIRRPNKPPTTGTQVYNAIARTGTGAAATVTGVGFAPDLVRVGNRSFASNSPFISRLTGPSMQLLPSATGGEDARTDALLSFEMNGVNFGSDAGSERVNIAGRTYINHFFKRAPGVFDICCYTGTGVAKTEAHGLGVVPELIIFKRRDSTADWLVGTKFTASTFLFLYLNLNISNTDSAYPSGVFTAQPTATTFSIASTGNVLNATGGAYVAYLFATKAGVSKVSSYVGNGSTQTIDCGFTTGARFFLVKATSTTSSWWIFDSVRGIISAADPALQLNSTAAEITSADAVDPHASGLIVNQEATCSINASGVSYIYLSLA